VRSIAAGKCFPDVLGVFAEIETNLSPERQLEVPPRPRPPASTRAGQPRSARPNAGRHVNALSVF
jgi:hypothetical protein